MTRPHPSPQVAIVVTSLVLLAFAAHAAEPAGPKAPGDGPSTAAASPPAPNKDEPKLICEQVQQMGSLFRRKVCATAEAWEARRRKDADQMQRMGDQGAGCGGVANPC